MASSKNGSSFAKRMWDIFPNESIRVIHTPLPIALAAGNLGRDTFRYFVSQQIYILKCFLHLYEISEKGLKGRNSIKMLINDTIAHVSFLEDSRYVSKNEYPEDLATKKYTEFLMATASGSIEGVDQENITKQKVAAYLLLLQ